MRIKTLAILGLSALFPFAAAAQDVVPGSLEEAINCVERNLPKTTSLQTVAFRTRDRVGSESTTRAKLFGKVFEGEQRKMVARFYDPPDIRGSALLVIEKDGRNDMFLYLPEFRRTKRVTAQAAGNSLFGTDFSYEDFERLQGLRKSRDTTRKPDDNLDGHSVYVLETRPKQEEESVYERIVSFVDKETCIALKTESYETGDRLRKVLTAQRDALQQKGAIWIAQEMVMKDLRDETETKLVIEEVEIDQPIPDKRFRQAELERHRD